MWVTCIIDDLLPGTTLAEQKAAISLSATGKRNFLLCPAVNWPGLNGLRNPSYTSANTEARQLISHDMVYYSTPSRFDAAINYRISGFFGFFDCMNPAAAAIVRNCRPKRALSDKVSPSDRILMGETYNQFVFGSTYYGYNSQASQEMVIHNGGRSTNHLFVDGHVAPYYKIPGTGLNSSQYPAVKFFAASEVP
jgi:prepilin-type processing-associated H-X9-DG protein